MTRFHVSFLIILLVSQLTAFGQITITSNHMPLSDDTIRYSIVNPTTVVDYNTGGANQNWDFTHVTPTAQGVYEYKSAGQVNLSYLLFFGLSAYGLKIFDTINVGTFNLTDGYDFYKNSSTTFEAVGRGIEYSGIPSPSFFTDDDEIYQFPLQYSDRDSSTFRVKNDFAGIISLIQKGYRINEVEGWGNVVTPYGSFNCLKVKTIINEADSIVISSLPLPSIPRITVEYKWLATEEKIPVFEVIGTEIGGQLTVTSIRYRDRPIDPTSGILQNKRNSNVKIQYYAPDEYVFEWPYSHPTEKIRLIDIKGQYVNGNISGSNGSYTLNVSDLNRGMYFVWIEAATFSEIVKIIKP